MAIDSATSTALLAGKRVAFVGKLGGLTRREAHQLVREHGGAPVDRPAVDVDLVVIGADELPLDEPEQLLGDALRQAAAEGRLEIISETQLWQRLGLVDTEQNVRRLYTPAMLAGLLHLPVNVIRRWHRRGLIRPVREVQRLPYFDFQEVATARRLAQLLAAGASPASIERKLAELAKFLPEVERPLAQLGVIVEGRRLLLRQGEGLVEPQGQSRFDFDAAEAEPNESSPSALARPATLLLSPLRHEGQSVLTPDELVSMAGELEDEGQLAEAANAYRAALAVGGPRAAVSFQLAEVLYRQGDLPAARERYYATLELDEDLVEARANLGCVLAELGERDLAVAAFEGALDCYPNYADAHYHLAITLDDLHRTAEAEPHWRTFLELAPDSSWADAARQRLEA